MSRVEALRRARKLRQEFRDTGREFTQSKFIEALTDLCSDLAGSALEGLVSYAGETVDKDATREREKAETILPGFDLEGEYKMGDGKRIAKEHARLEHMEAALRLDDANLVAVQEANQRKHDELECLRPYLLPGVAKWQAVERYNADHQESQGA
jgi:hypothetical protein